MLTRTPSVARPHAIVVAPLRARRHEIAQTIHACLPSPSPRYKDASSQAARAAAIAATLEYGLAAIERPGEWAPIPRALTEQARRAARLGVRPGVLVRCYLAGHECFMEFVGEEVRRSQYTAHRAVRERLCGACDALLDHVVVCLEQEHEWERERLACAPDERLATLVRRLLREDLGPAQLEELGYDVRHAWHIGVVALDAAAVGALHELQLAAEYRMLTVPGEAGTVWAWLGGKDRVSVAEFRRLLPALSSAHTRVAIGDPGQGLDGWRHTHQEAEVAALIAGHERQGLTRCADILPVAGALQSEAIVGMYERTYILPLDTLHRHGQSVRRSLLAYFKHNRNAASAGEGIKVTARTIQNHLNDARKVLDAPLNMTGLEIALRLEELGYMGKRDC